MKTRLARALGEEIAAKHPEHSGSSATVKDLRAQIENYSCRKATCAAARRGATPEAHAGP